LKPSVAFPSRRIPFYINATARTAVSGAPNPVAKFDLAAEFMADLLGGG
jgi:hypothetical protein